MNEQPEDTADYLGERETKVDMFPQSVELDAMPVEQPLSTETADMGGAGGVAWEHQYNGERFFNYHDLGSSNPRVHVTSIAVSAVVLVL